MDKRGAKTKGDEELAQIYAPERTNLEQTQRLKTNVHSEQHPD